MAFADVFLYLHHSGFDEIELLQQRTVVSLFFIRDHKP